MCNKLSFEIENELSRVKKLIYQRNSRSYDFDIRGGLYSLAFKVNHKARQDELRLVIENLKPLENEVGVDLAAGSGYLTQEIIRRSKAKMLAVDPSKYQLNALESQVAVTKTLCCSPDDESGMKDLQTYEIDFFTSLGGLHHVNRQDLMFRNIEFFLKKGGRFVAADVCENTCLARHFDEVVSRKCITGHSANWLSRSKIEKLATDHHFEVEQCKIESISWEFDSESQMALFFKALHAYDVSYEEILRDLNDYLGYVITDNKILLNWPLLIFKCVRR